MQEFPNGHASNTRKIDSSCLLNLGYLISYP